MRAILPERESMRTTVIAE